MKISRISSLLLCIALPVLAGEWYEDYATGKSNCDAGNYGTCIAKMNAAIGKKQKSEKAARTYGMNFTDYTPYYYLGHAYMQQGNIERADKFFQAEADYGVVYKTVNSGSFSLMSKQASQALQAGHKIQMHQGEVNVPREPQVVGPKDQSEEPSRVIDAGQLFRVHEDLQDMKGDLANLRRRLETLELGASSPARKPCGLWRHAELLLLLIAALQAAGLIVMLRRK